MINPLILLHAITAEVGVMAFLWVLVELLNPTESRIARAQVAAVVGCAALLFAWLVGGFIGLVSVEFKANELEVSATKCVSTASTSTLGKRLEEHWKKLGLNIQRPGGKDEA